MKIFFSRHWFMIGLVAALAMGFTASEALGWFADTFPKRALVALVLFLMSWSLNAHAIWRAVRQPGPALLGIAVNLLLVPAFAWIAAQFLAAPLDAGLALAAAVPCTLASAAVWTRRAGGNDAVALVVTMITNFSCFLVTPMLLWLGTGNAQLDFKPREMILGLLIVAVLPMIAGQLLRLIQRCGAWATRHRMGMSTVAQFGILVMVLIGAVKSAEAIGSASAEQAIGIGGWLAMFAAVAGVHLAALLAGFGLGRLAGMDRAEWIAVGLAGSQKTLMIGLHIAVTQDLGLAVLPMVAYHAVQLLLDTVVADRLRRGDVTAVGG